MLSGSYQVEMSISVSVRLGEKSRCLIFSVSSLVVYILCFLSFQETTPALNQVRSSTLGLILKTVCHCLLLYFIVNQ